MFLSPDVLKYTPTPDHERDTTMIHGSNSPDTDDMLLSDDDEDELDPEVNAEEESSDYQYQTQEELD